MTKHTPGPFAADSGHVWSETAKDKNGNAVIICRASRENAKRIAAALNYAARPQNVNADLLAALRDLESKIDALCLNGQFSVYTETASSLSVARGVARAAIAKADGVKLTPSGLRIDPERVSKRCPDCGQRGETKGHQTCQYPRD